MSITGNFIERSITGTLSFFKESVFSDEQALRKGLLQGREPRIKVATFLIFIILTLLLRSLTLLLSLYALCLLLAVFSRINLWFFLKRTWIFIPLFSFFIALPALFAVVVPGEPLFVFKGIAVTKPGLEAATLFLGRVTTGVSFAVLLSLVTRHSELLSVLSFFKVPKVFVMTLGMCYRYIYLFAEIVLNTYLGIKSRVGGALHYKKGQRIAVWKMAGLWQRSVQLNEEVYNAMISRGYTGSAHTMDEFKAGVKDWLWLFFVATVFVVLASLTYGK